MNWRGLHHTEPKVELISWTIFCGSYLTVPNKLRGIGCPLIPVSPTPLAIATLAPYGHGFEEPRMKDTNETSSLLWKISSGDPSVLLCSPFLSSSLPLSWHSVGHTFSVAQASICLSSPFLHLSPGRSLPNRESALDYHQAIPSPPFRFSSLLPLGKPS